EGQAINCCHPQSEAQRHTGSKRRLDPDRTPQLNVTINNRFLQSLPVAPPPDPVVSLFVTAGGRKMAAAGIQAEIDGWRRPPTAHAAVRQAEVMALVCDPAACWSQVSLLISGFSVNFRFLVVIQGETEVPSVAVTKSPQGLGLEGLEIEPDAYDIPADLSSDEEYLRDEEPDPSRAARLKKSMVKSTETLKAAFSKENMSKTKDNLGTKFHNLGEKVMPPERREKMHQAGERLKQSGERLKENIAKKAPTKETFRIKLKKERAVAEGQEGAEGEGEPAKEESAAETKREGPVEEAGATRVSE
ncbi:PREDICTED: muscle-related coiled-coil protein-like, partial [Poecilia mexicana]|uniref:muscle-related coiled-coil protein-like n=1 Tax=Poecilia mexicana TaxID=48701 RepID=UPI00072E5E18